MFSTILTEQETISIGYVVSSTGEKINRTFSMLINSYITLKILCVFPQSKQLTTYQLLVFHCISLSHITTIVFFSIQKKQLLLSGWILSVFELYFASSFGPLACLFW